MVDANEVAAIIEDVGKTIILPRFGKLAASQIRQKTSPTDLVTEIDLEAERSLKLSLAKVLPEAGFIGEESAAADPSIVAQLEGQGMFWVVDPLDGTRNFVHERTEFGSIVALVENSQTIGAWIYAPAEHLSAFALKGEGSYFNGRQISVRSSVASSDAERPNGLRSVNWLTPYWRDVLIPALKSNTRSQSGHCSAFAYLKTLTGEVDFKLSSRIHPWDHLAGALMLEEAGGAVRFLDDNENYAPADSIDRPLLATRPGLNWDGMAAVLR